MLSVLSFINEDNILAVFLTRTDCPVIEDVQINFVLKTNKYLIYLREIFLGEEQIHLYLVIY